MLLNCGAGEDSWECLGLQREQTHPSEWNQSWIFIGKIVADGEAPILWVHDAKSWLIGKYPDAGKDWRQKKGMTEDKIVSITDSMNMNLSKLQDVEEDRRALACR